MKRNINKKKISAFVLALSVFSNITANAGWLDKYTNAAGTTASGPYAVSGSGASRGFVSGGQFNVRFRESVTEPLVSVQAPRISGGCGGISLYAGSLSYLNFDQIVQKFENILKAAPAAAFDLALNTLCVPCANTMKSLNMMADAFNQLQVGDCAAAKGMMAFAVDNSGLVQNQQIKEGLQKNYQNTGLSSFYNKMEEGWKAMPEWSTAWDTAKTTTDNGCPEIIQTLITPDSSGKYPTLMQAATSKLGLPAEYAGIMAASVGDIRLKDGKGAYDATPYEPCDEMKQVDLAQLVGGQLTQRDPASGECKAMDQQTGVSELFKPKLTSIRDKMVSRSSLSANDIALLNGSPFALPVLLRGAIAAGYDEQIVDYASTYYGITYMKDVLKDLTSVIYRTNDYMIRLFAGNSKPVNDKDKACLALSTIPNINEKLKAMNGYAEKLQQNINTNYYGYATDLMNKVETLTKYAALDEQMRNYVAKSFSSSIAQRLSRTGL